MDEQHSAQEAPLFRLVRAKEQLEVERERLSKINRQRQDMMRRWCADVEKGLVIRRNSVISTKYSLEKRVDLLVRLASIDDDVQDLKVIIKKDVRVSALAVERVDEYIQKIDSAILKYAH